ncbi:peptidase domain-containing ABC transporter [Proteus mirabilis]|uniref:peptidase domain-containing ABC transporter n=1 Tax=Proteus mirabilis TaxID=584 RepID=UPI00376E4DAA
MKNRESTKFIKSINIILNLSGKQLDNTKPNINKYDDTIASLEKKHAFKLKKKNIHYIFKKQLHYPMIFLDRSKNIFILLKYNNNEFLIYNLQTDNMETWNKERLINNSINHYYYLDFSEKHFFDITWFVPTFMKYRILFQSVLFYSLILQLLALASPIITQIIMDKVIIHQALSTLDVLIIGLIFVAVSESVLKGIREYIYHHTANKIDMLLSLKLTNHLFKLPISYFKSRQTGIIVTRVKELDIIREFITKTLLMLLVDFSFIFIFLFVMAYLSLKLTLIFLATIPLYFILAKLIAPKIEKTVQQLYQYSATNSAFLTETLGGIETIKSLSLEPRFTQQWHTQIHQLTNENLKLQNIDNLSQYIVSFLQKITTAILLCLGAFEVISLAMTIGQLIAFNMLLNHCLQPLSSAIEVWGKYIRAKTAIYNLQDILNLPIEQEKANKKMTLQGEVSFENVSFSYQHDAPPVVRQISFRINEYETIGIVGTSGSGKSTLARIIAGLYIPQLGQVKLDDIPVCEIPPAVLRQQIGFVLQENFLFHLTVLDNIRLTQPSASLDEVIHVAKLAGAHEFILKLPLGYDTLIAENGRSLSGGQCQRIAIARALLSSPKILIFDEATSALDGESQAIIEKNLPLITQDKTVIMIAHRLSTIKNCDRIIVLEKGQIIEEGKHNELIRKDGAYKKLWQHQQG